jgi:ATP-binding cassette subfamily B protein
MLRENVRLVILDEPFRGLDREKRHELLRRVRSLWKDCTLLCITHDIAETEGFDSVVVVENGTVAEQGSPSELREHETSRYAQLLAAEMHARSRLWSGEIWRRVRVQNGRAIESVRDINAEDAAEVA